MEVYQDYEPGYKSSMLKNEYLQNWVFVFNPFTQFWNAVPRQSYNDYWNDYGHTDVIKSSSIFTLLELLHKTLGDKDRLEKLTES